MMCEGPLEKELVEGVTGTCKVKDYELLETEAEQGELVSSRLSLKDHSWQATGGQAVEVRRMLLETIKVARRHKFELVTNLNIKGTTDSLLFQHRPSLQDIPEDLFILSLNR